ncbi:hypothetical protein EC9_10390 [Rosistilla ulvae]|uniref:Prepilin-type N-terminal cleavage/methylation domain-containing protein n=1 Tax=Rosistilla ulvae TaxID=1930277 RepID=A0A517LW59_9BACT|nr:prepilin-type N-terminal cleavage/methylation domain-containing protein [Rosistilla ulvae]QDS86864.1 hypothetical protein EC9_10390 [Rosistilla ulvae]
MNNPTVQSQHAYTTCRRSAIVRPGFTLIELIMAMSIGSVLMLLAIGVVHQALTFSKLGQGRADQDRTLVRLDRQFRNDVHRSRGFELTDRQTVELTIDDNRRVVYAIDENQIQRHTADDGKQQDRELFLLDDRSTIELQMLDAPQRLGIVVRSDTGLQGVPQRTDRQIVAVPGLLYQQLPNRDTSPPDAEETSDAGDQAR